MKRLLGSWPITTPSCHRLSKESSTICSVRRLRTPCTLVDEHAARALLPRVLAWTLYRALPVHSPQLTSLVNLHVRGTRTMLIRSSAARCSSQLLPQAAVHEQHNCFNAISVDFCVCYMEANIEQQIRVKTPATDLSFLVTPAFLFFFPSRDAHVHQLACHALCPTPWPISSRSRVPIHVMHL